MKVLILGGTGFLGPHIVEAAIAAGHVPTLFNRGKSNTLRFPELETLIGDRDPDIGGGLSSLQGRVWDAAIDVCGYVPRHVRASSSLLAPSVHRYVFISTISVYSDLSQTHIDEQSPVGTLLDHAVEKVTGETYGPMKVRCEQAAETAMPARVLSLRPGLIVGPGDTTDRFTYWPVRISRGGEVLAPGDPQGLVQFIDARDLARFVIHAVEQELTGVMNTTGPAGPFTMGEMLSSCQRVTQSSSKLTWVSSEFLLQHGVAPWSGIPLWVPDTPQMRGFARISSQAAMAAGLQFRPLDDIARDTLSWFASREEKKLRAGLTPERERELLDVWQSGTDQ